MPSVTLTTASHVSKDETVPQPIASSAHITPHYKTMSDMPNRYRSILGISYNKK
jgi:hypothetical protein